MKSLKLTASEAQAIAAGGKGLDSLVTRLVACHLSNGDPKRFTSLHTSRGNDLEPTARELYGLEHGVTVETVGFVQADEYVGFSPDGLVGDEGGTEIKSPDDIEYYRLMRDKENAIDTGYLWQCQMSLLLSGRKWWDLIFYNPNMPITLLIFRILPDEKKHQKLIAGLDKGVEMIKSQLAQFI